MKKSYVSTAVTSAHDALAADFFAFAQCEMNRKSKNGNFSSAENLGCALKCLRRFWGVDSLPFSSFDRVLMSDFRDWLCSEDKKESTVRLYLNLLRQVYNRAVKEGFTEDVLPFSDVRTGTVFYRQPVLSEREVSLVMTAEVKPGTWAERAKHFVCLMYMLCGIPPVDLIFLTWKQIDLKRMTLTYGRKKTGVGTTVRLPRESLAILKMYKDKGMLGYVFPFITTTDPEKARRQCKNAERQLNRALQNIGRKVGLECGFRLYSFRRSWASVAHNDHNVPMPVISLALCHANERNTAIYVSRLDNNRLFFFQSVVWKRMRTLIGTTNGKHLDTSPKRPQKHTKKNVSLWNIGRHI